MYLMSDISADSDEEATRAEEALAGALGRSGARVLVQTLGPRIATSLGKSLPGRIPIRAVGRGADNLSKVLDVAPHLRKDGANSAKSSTKTHPLRHRIIPTAINITRSLGMGTLLFEVFAYGAETAPDRSMKKGNDKEEKGSADIFPRPLRAATCGITAGCVHGMTTFVLDHILYPTMTVRVSKTVYVPKVARLWGLTVSHGIIHGVLFGGFSLFLHGYPSSSLSSSSSSTSAYEQIAAVACAGAAAGVLSESVGGATACLEEKGLRDGLRSISSELRRGNIATMFAPGRQAVMSGFLSGGLGFLAYCFSELEMASD